MRSSRWAGSLAAEPVIGLVRFRRSRPQEPPPETAPVTKARRLLMSKLTVDQRRTFPDGWFDVTGSLGGQYKIWTGSVVQNISQDLPGLTPAMFCVAPRTAQPAHDVLLSQKLLIEADEGAFLRIAEKTGGYRIPQSYRSYGEYYHSPYDEYYSPDIRYW